MSNSYSEFISIFNAKIKYILYAYIIPFLKRCNKLGYVWSLRVDFMVAMKYGTNIVSANFLVGALQMTFPLKNMVILTFKCSNKFNLPCGALCSLHFVSTLAMFSPI